MAISRAAELHGADELDFAQSLHTAGPTSMRQLLERSELIQELATAICDASEELVTSKSNVRRERPPNDRFQQGPYLKLSYGSIGTFYGGLEAKLGAPDPSVAQAIRREHLEKDDSNNQFTAPNYGIT